MRSLILLANLGMAQLFQINIKFKKETHVKGVNMYFQVNLNAKTANLCLIKNKLGFHVHNFKKLILG